MSQFGDAAYSVFFIILFVSHINQLFLKNEHTVKKFSDFLSPAGMSITKLSLAGNNLITCSPGQEEFGK